MDKKKTGAAAVLELRAMEIRLKSLRRRWPLGPDRSAVRLALAAAARFCRIAAGAGCQELKGRNHGKEQEE